MTSLPPRLTATLAAGLLLTALGCAKKDDKANPAPTPVPTAPAPTPEPPIATQATNTFVVEASHAKPKPSDPVRVQVPISVVSATFDPDDLEGASAELALDFANLDSGNPKRNNHLTKGYLEVARFAAGTIKIRDVVKKDAAYAATAVVGVRGIEKEMAVTFEVTGKTADSVSIRAEHAFKRSDFGIGGSGEDESAADELVARLEVTFER